MRWLTSFRSRILLLVLGAALLPMLASGWWITGTASRAGELLLRDNLSELLESHAASVADRWRAERSVLLDLGDEPAVQAWLLGTSAAEPIEVVRRHADRLGPAIARIRVRRPSGDGFTVLAGDEPVRAEQSATVRVELDVFARGGNVPIGIVEAETRLGPLLAQQPAGSWIRGALLEAVDRESGMALLASSVGPDLLARPSFLLLDEMWVAVRRPLPEPAVDLIAAAPLTIVTRPLEGLARNTRLLLLAAAPAALLLGAVVTGRLTRSLRRLTAAAEDVAKGNLEQRIGDESKDEVGRVARAFDDMAASLHTTLNQLSRNQSMAAVGEFAAELAHEIRNPLTALRLDLQIVHEKLPPDSPMRRVQQAALDQVDRLDRAVSGALQLARSGRFETRPVPLLPVVEAAVHSAAPAVERRGARLHACGDSSVHVIGDADAIQRMLLNLIINAANAVSAGGRVDVHYAREGANALISIRDNGDGIPAERLEKIRAAIPTGSGAGTGLGLGIASRIAAAHHGSLSINSHVGAGTIVSVRLPAL
jgi:signal transduction histidine kinase